MEGKVADQCLQELEKMEKSTTQEVQTQKMERERHRENENEKEKERKINIRFCACSLWSSENILLYLLIPRRNSYSLKFTKKKKRKNEFKKKYNKYGKREKSQQQNQNGQQKKEMYNVRHREMVPRRERKYCIADFITKRQMEKKSKCKKAFLIRKRI